MIKLKDLLFEGVYDPGILKGFFLAGGPGSGKGFVASGLFGIPSKVNVSSYGLKVVNQDQELEMFLKKYGFGTDLDDMDDDLYRQLVDPTYKDYSGTRTHAKVLSKERLRLYSEGRLGVIVDGTGHKYSSIIKEKKMLEAKGYDTYMIFVYTSLEIAQRRNMERKRKLSPEIVEKYWNEVQSNKISFQGLFGNANYMMVDNSKTLDEKSAIKKFSMLIKKGIGKFIKKPVKNYLGKQWIEKQKILKKR
jgi:predicted kinase